MRALATATPLAVAVALAATLAACGSNTPATVTVTKTVPARTSTTTTATKPGPGSSTTSSSSSTSSSTSAQTQSSASTTSTTATSSSTSTSSTATTRTETAPAFVGTNPASNTAAGRALQAALAVLAKHGYEALGTATYDAGDTLRVLIGRQHASTSERAFFFDQATYLGTDAAAPSDQITLVGQNDTEVVLAYGIYRPGASAPSSERRVHFALDMGQLSALDPLPSVAQRR
jgi:hypothetical protein